MIEISNNDIKFVESPNIIKVYSEGYKLFGIISYGKNFLVEAKHHQKHMILILDQSLNEVRRIEDAIFKRIYNDEIIFHDVFDEDILFKSIDNMLSCEYQFRWTYLKDKMFKSSQHMRKLINEKDYIGCIGEKINKYLILRNRRRSEFVGNFVFITDDVLDVVYLCDHLLLLYEDRLELYKDDRLIHTINDHFEGIFPGKSKVRLYKKDFTYEEFDVGCLKKSIKYINNFADVIINV